ncbi:hypothetical protein L5515_005701 [Caenorhabditis briggsae]|uniref:SCP domain-containing protein n=1 Tax=Caenorhabditis briggsae TaxID=6238 RepID=A0AAE9EU15_CAEBR|nr:hypothetical protein L5515_005701 [Caenorhabditis briggsae]
MKLFLLGLALLGSKVAAGGFSRKAQDAIVEIHNKLRSKLALGIYKAKGSKMPPAMDMLEMSWDDTIARSAQEFADTCPMSHRENYKNKYGENIYRAFSSAEVKEDLGEYGLIASKKWEAEFNKFGWESRTYGICNYQKKGNVKGLEVYKEGKTCSSCPSNTSCDKDSGLYV